MEIADSQSENDEQNITEKEKLIPQKQNIYVRKRWLILFVYSLNSFMQGELYMSLLSVNNITSRYYNVSGMCIEVLALIIIGSLILLSIPASYSILKFGVKRCVVAVSFLHSISLLIRFIGHNRGDYWILLVSQFIAALASPIVYTIVGRVATLWFPDHQRATASSIGVAANVIGTTVGFIVPSLLVKNHDNLKHTERELRNLYVMQLVPSLVVLFVTLIFMDEPAHLSHENSCPIFCPAASPQFPSLSTPAKPEKKSFLDDVNRILRNRHFLLLANSFGISVGLLNTLPSILNPLITSKYKTGYELEIGMMGANANIVGVVSTILIGRLVDKYQFHYMISMVLRGLSAHIWLVFFLAFLYTDMVRVSYCLYVAWGFLSYPLWSTGIEHAAQITFPVHAHASTAVMMIVADLYALFFTLIFGYFLENGKIQVVGYTILGFHVVAFFLGICVKTELKRSEDKN